MDAPKKRCFVVMGFGKKTDLSTGRTLDLDASYYNLIKPAVEEAGLECVRADEIAHSGNINVPMYEQLLEADLVIADLSTANAVAFYELGVRHGLRPYRTIVIAEDQFKQSPFDMAHTAVRTYRHLGEDISVSEARRFSDELKRAITDIFERETPLLDSPVYAFLRDLRPPVMSGVLQDTAEQSPDSTIQDAATTRDLFAQVDEAQKEGDFVTAKAILTRIRKKMKEAAPERPEDPYVIQQLALATYKSKQPTPQLALEEARELLLTLNPETSNDTETLGLWGAVHKRLWDETHERENLDESVRGYERGFYLRNDYYNGINLAYLLNVRAVNASTRADAVADFIEAQRVRREVLTICEQTLADDNLSGESRYWVLATMAEAYLGTGEEAQAEMTFKEAASVASAEWMTAGTEEQMSKLRAMLSDSPLKYVIAASNGGSRPQEPVSS